MNTTDIDRQIAEARERNARRWERLSRADLRTEWDTGNGPLVLVASRWAQSDEAATLEGDDFMEYLRSQPYAEVVLTQDGRSAPLGRDLRWHHGDTPDADEWVYYERWTAEGRVGHGYLHPETRRLVQSG